MTPAPQFSSHQNPDGEVVLAVTGEIDMSNSAVLDSAVESALGASPAGHRLVVDLSEVEYLDSAGLTVLFNHADRVRLIASTLLRSVLTLSGLTELTTVEIV